MISPLVAFLLFIPAVVGLTQIIVDSDMPLVVWGREKGKVALSKIPGGNWVKVLECYQCCGTWCGFITGGMLFCPDICVNILGYFNSIFAIVAMLILMNVFIVLICGFAGSYLAQWGVTYTEYLKAQTLITLKDD